MVLASRKASFGLPGIKIGLFCTTPAVPVVRCLPTKLTFEMLCTGEPVCAETAFKHGLVNKIADGSEQLHEMCDELVAKIANHSREVIALGKSEFYNQLSKSTLEEAYNSATPVMTQNAELEQCQEGITAFFDKRKPKFSS